MLFSRQLEISTLAPLSTTLTLLLFADARSLPNGDSGSRTAAILHLTSSYGRPAQLQAMDYSARRETLAHLVWCPLDFLHDSLFANGSTTSLYLSLLPKPDRVPAAESQSGIEPPYWGPMLQAVAQCGLHPPSHFGQRQSTKLYRLRCLTTFSALLSENNPGSAPAVDGQSGSQLRTHLPKVSQLLAQSADPLRYSTLDRYRDVSARPVTR